MSVLEKSIASEIDIVFNSQQSKSILLRSTNAAERIRQLEKLQDWIKSHLEDIRKEIYADFKKPYPEIDSSEIFVVTSEIKHTIKNLSSWMQPKQVSTPMTMLGSESHIQYEPKGSTLIISPWNYPFNLALGPLVSALAAGCTAVIKPSELTPHTSALIKRMIEEIYEPELVAVFEGEVEVAEYLLSKPFDHIFFTGSPAVGKVVMKAAAAHLTSVTLELGGKSPAIIDSKVDIQDAASKIVWGKFVNCGQTCIAPDYLLVQASVKNELLEAIQKKIIEMYDPQSKGVEQSKDYARIVNDRHLKRLKDLLEDANHKGANTAVGGEIKEDQNYFEPTVLTDVTDDMQLMEEEIFGPILPIMTYSNTTEAIHYINNKPKPLALYVFSNSKEVAETILKQTSSGAAVVNDCVVHFMQNELPFGGVNNSGMGKAHGHFGFLTFSNEKAVLKQRVGFTPSKALYPPYNYVGKKISQALLKWF